MTHLTAPAAERGQTMAEYAVTIGVITLALAAIFVALGDTATEMIATVANRV